MMCCVAKTGEVALALSRVVSLALALALGRGEAGLFFVLRHTHVYAALNQRLAGASGLAWDCTLVFCFGERSLTSVLAVGAGLRGHVWAWVRTGT